MATKLLFNEQPIVIDRVLAGALGIKEAIVLQQIYYWVEINKKAGKNFYDGRYWTYNSIRAWQENDFSYMSAETVKRTFTKLEKEGYLLTGNYNKDKRDVTKWYTVNEEKLQELAEKLENEKNEREKIALEEAKKEEEQRENEEKMEEIFPLGQNDLMHLATENDSVKMTQPIRSDCTNPLGQNDPMRRVNLTQCISNRDFYRDFYREYHQPSPNSNLSTGEIFENQKGGGGEPSIAIHYEKVLNQLKQQVEFLSTPLSLPERKNWEEILMLLTDVMMQPSGAVIINQTKVPVEIVKHHFLQLSHAHMEYILDVIMQNQFEIKNYRSYVLTIAFNAIHSMENYYANLANKDLKQMCYERSSQPMHEN